MFLCAVILNNSFCTVDFENIGPSYFFLGDHPLEAAAILVCVGSLAPLAEAGGAGRVRKTLKWCV